MRWKRKSHFWNSNIARIFFKIPRNISKNQSQKSRHFGFSWSTFNLNLISFCKYLSIVNYTISNGISKFQCKISRKTVIIGMVLYDSFCYIVVMLINISTQLSMNVKQNIWVSLSGWLSCGACADIHMSSFR